MAKRKRKTKCDRILEEREGVTYKTALAELAKVKDKTASAFGAKVKGKKMVCIGKYKGRNRYNVTTYYN